MGGCLNRIGTEWLNQAARPASHKKTFFDELKEIPRRFPDIDLALLHLGGTMFFGLLMVTMDPKQGVEVIRLVKPKTAIPIHYDDYTAFEFALGCASTVV